MTEPAYTYAIIEDLIVVPTEDGGEIRIKPLPDKLLIGRYRYQWTPGELGTEPGDHELIHGMLVPRNALIAALALGGDRPPR